MRADLHVHSCFSMDSSTRIDSIVRRCIKANIGCVAIADHGTADGGLALQKVSPPFKVIVAEEILADEGEIIGLFLKRTIPSGIPAAAAIARIREQGGLVLLPHPCDMLRESSLRTEQAISEILPHADIVEVYNSRAIPPDANPKALRLATEHGKLKSAGSDAHIAEEIGNAYVEMLDFDGPQEFMKALAEARVFGRHSTPLQRAAGLWQRTFGRFGNGRKGSQISAT